MVKELQRETPFNFDSFENEKNIYSYIFFSNSNWSSAGSGLIPAIFSENFQIVQHQIRDYTFNYQLDALIIIYS